MKVKIERLHYAEFWNSEYPLVAEQTISIAEKYDMEGMHLGKSFAELSFYRSPMNAMSVYVRRNAKLQAAGLLDSERDTLINGFRKAVDSMQHVDMPQVKQHFETLDALLAKHKAHTMAAAARTSETERLNMLEKDIAANDAAQAAIEAFGLQNVVQRLFDANREYEQLFRDFIADKSAEEHIDVPALRRECNKALNHFFDAVQYCAFEHEDVDYSALVKELNQLNSYYRQQLKARATRRKNGKDTNSEEPITPPEN